MARFGFYLYSAEGDDFRTEAECLSDANCKPIFSHKYTNASDNLDPLIEIIKRSDESDVIVVRSLELLASSLRQLDKVLSNLIHRRVHIEVLDQEPINTLKYGKETVYFYLRSFSEVEYNFMSINNRKAERTKLKRYKGWSSEKIDLAINVFEAFQKGLKMSEIQKIFSISYTCAKRYVYLVESGEINNIKKSIARKKIKKPIGRAEGPIKVNKSKPELVKILREQNIRAMDIQAQLKISKGTYYRYLRMA